MDGEQTIVAKVTSDLENFKETMDASIMAQVASLSTFNDVRAINNAKQNIGSKPNADADKIVVEATNTIPLRLVIKTSLHTLRKQLTMPSGAHMTLLPKPLLPQVMLKKEKRYGNAILLQLF